MPSRSRGIAGGVALVLLAFAGCLPRADDGADAGGWLRRMRGLGGVAVPVGGGLFLESALVEAPAPDPFLSHDLWAGGVALNPLSAEQTALLELNGLRVRVTAGVAPPQLQKMLSSEESAVSPMARTLRPGQTKVVPVNGPLPQVHAAVRRTLRDDPVSAEWAAAECGLAVTARPGSGGKVRLRCELQVQHGGRQMFLAPAADGSGFTRSEQKPLELFPSLGWDVDLGPGEFLVVGSTQEPSNTLGGAFFLRAESERVRQRVLVVRAARGAAEVTPLAAGSPAAASARPLARGFAE